jgi:hypothetical protein
MTTVKEQHQHPLKELLLRTAVLFDTAVTANLEEQQPLPPTKPPVNNKQQQQDTETTLHQSAHNPLGSATISLTFIYMRRVLEARTHPLSGFLGIT